ncbi:MAG: alginate O-acetyltransferase complex protein AlgI [Verrucomicrobiales bacterium]
MGFSAHSNTCNFFIGSFADLSRILGLQVHLSTLNIILPVGISFYTFQTLSYTIDVYRNKIDPSRDPVAFFAFVSFFPQLVAGPIERATRLLPQFKKSREFDCELAKDGLRQILWGFAKKILVADSCAQIVNQIFDSSDYAALSPTVLAAGAVFFAFQIYGDFSGYSDIAIGTAKLFGFRLMRNFAYPYFSRDMAEFWRRWHISLSTWFRDYVYIPLGGSRGSLAGQIRNVFIIFLVSGFWHGANWTFIVWGGLNALYFLPLLLSKRHLRHTDSEISQRFIPPVRTLLRILFTFGQTCLAWIFFRAESLTEAIAYLAGFLSGPVLPASFLYLPPGLILTLVLFTIFEWYKRHHEHPLTFRMTPVAIRWGLYQLLFWLILFNWVFHDASEFIYFQF